MTGVQTCALPIFSLASSGLLVNIAVSVWSATKQDKAISEEVTTAKRADASAGKYTKHLLADHPRHKAITNYRQTIYNWVKRRTYPWDGASMYLPTFDVEKFKAEYDAHRVTFMTLVEEFITDYQNIVSDMAFAQGDMFNRDDYPSVEKARAKFDMELFINDVPENDYRCLVSQSLADDLYRTYTKQTQRIIGDKIGRAHV